MHSNRGDNICIRNPLQPIDYNTLYSFNMELWYIILLYSERPHLVIKCLNLFYDVTVDFMLHITCTLDTEVRQKMADHRKQVIAKNLNKSR